MKLFSVIIPTYNRPSALFACLGGLARLRYPAEAFEVLVQHFRYSRGALHFHWAKAARDAAPSARRRGFTSISSGIP